ncbi:MAG: DUF1848 domain-containing protein [Alphaproteobacteria bacterium]|nr:DUF1848 domain-containing protein [Alphaproteobacteria bacterium]
MIVSASYRTDIPAFYGAWFEARYREGQCRVRNPYGGKDLIVPLRRTEVDGYVFWTRNPAPFTPILERLAADGMPYTLQVTVTGYPKSLDTRTPPPDRVIDAIAALPKGAAVWRYDPLVASDLTPLAWHRENFARLARRFRGLTDEVVVSWMQVYAKTQRHLDAAAKRHGFAWRDPQMDEKRDVLRDLAAIAAEEGLRLTVCSQGELLSPGIEGARCIDAERLSRLAGRIIAAKTKGNRPGCLCAESRDIGAYDTCPHGCVYCYAVASRPRAAARAKAIRPSDDRL